uniref:DUF1758 domain-containing protein n=1 Tax=Meloidogyne enterolobii TaxID=390850 RepID=A0A6V7VVX7_MELEN|nr:unnamed protein product [Meloidogyne enterolobii]
MSAAFRIEIEALLEEAHAILEARKTFNIPLKGPAQTENKFYDSIRTILSELNLEHENVSGTIDELSKAHGNWMSLRNNMTGPERLADNSAYDQFYAQHPYMEALTQLKQYKRHLRSAQRLFEGALPSASAQSTSHAHIPRMILPTFSGKSADFLSFWNQFSAAIGNLASLSDAVKLSYLKSCLTGPPLAIIESLPLTDDSYGQAIHLLENKFNNKEEIVRSLYQAIKALPYVRKGEFFNQDFAVLTDSLESILIQFKQHNSDPNVPSIFMDIEAKLPNFVLEEIFKTKEQLAGRWTTDDLKECLKAIRKRREEINSIHPSRPIPLRPNFQQSSSNRLEIPVSNRLSLPFNRQPPTRNLQPTPPLNFSMVANQQSNRNPGFRHPCLFCNDPRHITTYCEKFPDYNSRISLLNELKLCSRCLKPNHNFKNCPNPSQCKNCHKTHPRPLCGQILAKNNSNTNTRKNQIPAANYTSRNFYINNAPQQKQTRVYENNQQINANEQYINRSSPRSLIPSTSTAIPPNQQNQNFSILPQNTNIESRNAAEFSAHTLQKTATNSISTLASVAYPVLLKCVLGRIFNPSDPSKQIIVPCLLDDGSTNSYILSAAAEALKLPLEPINIQIGVFNQQKCAQSPAFSTKIGIQLVNGRTLTVSTTTLNFLTHPLPVANISPNQLSPDSIPAELLIQWKSPIVLLGSDVYYDIEPTPVAKLPNGYRLVHTLLGPLIAGKSEINPPNRLSNTIYHSHSYFNHNYKSLNIQNSFPPRPSVDYSSVNFATPTPSKYKKKMKAPAKTKMKQQKLIPTANNINTLPPTIIKTTTTNHPPINTTTTAKSTFCNNKFRKKYFFAKKDLANTGNVNFKNKTPLIPYIFNRSYDDKMSFACPTAKRPNDTNALRPPPLMSLQIPAQVLDYQYKTTPFDYKWSTSLSDCSTLPTNKTLAVECRKKDFFDKSLKINKEFPINLSLNFPLFSTTPAFT